MKKQLLIGLFLLGCFASIAQVNIVPNPSFEDTVHCPDNLTEIYYATSWSAPTVGGTSDYFNSCSNPSYVGIPNNRAGYQFAKTGNGYAGLSTFFYSDYREYIQAKLDSTLLAFHKYCVTFYVSLSDTVSIACNNIGIYFSDTAVHENNSFQLNFSPQISNNISINPLTNKLGWSMISGSFVANGGEYYLTIGNFLNNANSDTVLVTGGSENSSYYYIDDISVVDCTGIGIDELTVDKMHFKLYPNPNNGNMVLEYKIGENETGLITIYDITGRMVKQEKLNAENKTLLIHANELNAGTYYYEIKVGDKKVKLDKLVIIK